MDDKRNKREALENFVAGILYDREPPEAQGPGVRLLVWLLRQASGVYRSVVQARLWLYEQGILRHHALGCQVISIGNLTMGGTGKTPVVEIFARELQRQGRRVAILSRGYKKVEDPWVSRLGNKLLMRESRVPPRVVSDGRTLLLDSEMSGDEPYMLASHLPSVAVLVDKDRVKSGRYAINKLGCDTLILDDGFQYLSLKHRLDIVLVDRTNPFGNREVLPRGILREPVTNLGRASFIFITKCDGSSNEELKEMLRELNDRAEIIECAHRPRFLQDVFGGDREGLEWLKGRQVAAVSGIAAPEGFERELRERGAQVVWTRRFADHHRYTQQQMIDLINRAKETGVEAILTTEKDAVRFPKIERRDVPVYFLRVDIELLSGAEDFHECIARICFRQRARS